MNIVQLTTLVFLGLNLVLGTVITVGANLYEISQVKIKNRLSKPPHKRGLRPRPLLSILVATDSDATGLKNCLFSIVKNNYQKYEIIILAPNKRGAVKRVVSEFTIRYPKRPLQLLTGKNYLKPKVAAKLIQGELVMVLKAEGVLGKNALINSVKRFGLDDRVKILLIDQQPVSEKTLANLLQQFQHLIFSQFQKSVSVIRLGLSRLPADANAIYRYETYINGVAAGERGYRYASDIVVYTLGIASFWDLIRQQYRQKLFSLQNRPSYVLNFLGQIIILSGVVLATYFIYLAIFSHTAFLFGLSWLGLSIFLWLAVWGSEPLTLLTKLKLSLLVPMMYGPLYIIAIVELLTTGLLIPYVFFKKLLIRIRGGGKSKINGLKTIKQIS